MLSKVANFLTPREKILGPAIKLETHISVGDQFISFKKCQSACCLLSAGNSAGNHVKRCLYMGFISVTNLQLLLVCLKLTTLYYIIPLHFFSCRNTTSLTEDIVESILILIEIID